MIRTGKFKDINGMIRVCHLAHEESVSMHVPIDEAELRKTLQVIVNSREHCCFVTEIDGQIEGLMLGVSNPLWYSRKKQAADLFLYTTEKGRGTGHLLMRRYISWAKRQPGVKEIMIGINSGIDYERTIELYKRMGATQIGAMFYIER